MGILCRSIRIAMLSLATSFASAQVAPAPAPLDVLKGRPGVPATDESGSVQLGEPFESIATGIAFRPPADCKEIRRAGMPDEIVQYVDDKRQWVFQASHFTLGQPMSLLPHTDAQGKPQPGLLAATADQLKQTLPGAEFLRQDAISVVGGEGGHQTNTGMIVLRYSLGTHVLLKQQAIIRASDLSYYLLDFTTPGIKPIDPANPDPQEKAAVETFSAVLDSVKLLDRSIIRDDQVQRLFRTRAALLGFTEAKLRAILVPEQWYRLIKDGKDIGYTYVVEEQQKPDRTPGVYVGVRSRTIPEQGVQADAGSWMFVAFDRKQEDWSNVVRVSKPQAPPYKVLEFGASLLRIKPVVDPNLIGKDRVQLTEDYHLDVSFFGKSVNGQPISRPLPPWYLPQALSHLLPRLLPLREPKTYMFATYVSENREVMERYVDVGREMSVVLGGKRFEAIPILDKLGLEGSATTHYMSPEGQYLGSVNAESKITVLPTDAQTLRGIWQNADLTRPTAPIAPGPASAPDSDLMPVAPKDKGDSGQGAAPGPRSSMESGTSTGFEFSATVLTHFGEKWRGGSIGLGPPDSDPSILALPAHAPAGMQQP